MPHYIAEGLRVSLLPIRLPVWRGSDKCLRAWLHACHLQHGNFLELDKEFDIRLQVNCFSPSGGSTARSSLCHLWLKGCQSALMDQGPAVVPTAGAGALCKAPCVLSSCRLCK